MFLLLIGFSLYFGGFNFIKELVKNKNDVKELKHEMREHDSLSALYAKNSREREALFIDSLNVIRKVSKKLIDSIEYLHISYMNDSYLKENHDTEATYWYVNYTHTEWKVSDGKTKRVNYFTNHIIKLDGQFSLVDMERKICYKYDLEKKIL